ncbi:MAG: hypothetical protein ACPGXK_11295 [Phycisphaerae bacterium]
MMPIVASEAFSQQQEIYRHQYSMAMRHFPMGGTLAPNIADNLSVAGNGDKGKTVAKGGSPTEYLARTGEFTDADRCRFAENV